MKEVAFVNRRYASSPGRSGGGALENLLAGCEKSVGGGGGGGGGGGVLKIRAPPPPPPKVNP